MLRCAFLITHFRYYKQRPCSQTCRSSSCFWAAARSTPAGRRITVALPEAAVLVWSATSCIALQSLSANLRAGARPIWVLIPKTGTTGCQRRAVVKWTTRACAHKVLVSKVPQLVHFHAALGWCALLMSVSAETRINAGCRNLGLCAAQSLLSNEARRQ